MAALASASACGTTAHPIPPAQRLRLRCPRSRRPWSSSRMPSASTTTMQARLGPPALSGLSTLSSASVAPRRIRLRHLTTSSAVWTPRAQPAPAQPPPSSFFQRGREAQCYVALHCARPVTDGSPKKKANSLCRRTGRKQRTRRVVLAGRSKLRTDLPPFCYHAFSCPSFFSSPPSSFFGFVPQGAMPESPAESESAGTYVPRPGRWGCMGSDLVSQN